MASNQAAASFSLAKLAAVRRSGKESATSFSILQRNRSDRIIGTNREM